MELNSDTVKELTKYKWGRVLLCFILLMIILLLVLSTIRHYKRCADGLNSRLFWGMEECLECKTIKIESVTKHDTIYLTKLAPSYKTSANNSKIKDKELGISISQKLDSGSSGIQNNNSTISGQQAGRDINNYGIIPRNITENDIEKLIAAYPDKKTNILIRFYGNPDGEMISVKNKIIQLLREKGYVNVSDRHLLIIRREIAKGIEVEREEDGVVLINIPPNQL